MSLLKKQWEFARKGLDNLKSLLKYRTTPLAGVEVSPSELLNNRMLRAASPITRNLLNQNQKLNITKLKETREMNNIYYDRGTGYKKDFDEDESVLIRKENDWLPGQVLNKTVYPRSDNMKYNLDNVYTRNSYFLKHNLNPATPPRGSPKNVNVPVRSSLGPTQNEKVIPASDPSSSFSTNVTMALPHETASAPSDNVYHTRSGRAVVKPIRFLT